ncbi:hypothetical protein OMK64_18080 [Cellulomonas fimi]|uniref:hypothetical protein n=1 Tax=Cellulomonas fimi TaxID=1708 RepID=UPI00234C0658|nr:hypothetical protein [Cellulomonas fimi]MDC7123443.1 hypothetical protein [Cellulomonas fimi]
MSGPAAHAPGTTARSASPTAAARHRGAAAPGRPAHPPGVTALLALQRAAGNRAVTALLHGPVVVQRGKGTVLVWSGGGGPVVGGGPTGAPGPGTSAGAGFAAATAGGYGSSGAYRTTPLPSSKDCV